MKNPEHKTLAIPPGWIFCLLILFFQVWGLFTISLSSGGLNFMIRQSLWCAAGWLLFLIISLVPFPWLAKHMSLPLTLLALLALLAVLPLGVRINGMRGWFEFRGCLLQPSEAAKVAYLLMLFTVWMKFKDRKIFIPCACAVFAAFAIPICLQPDFGGAAVYLVGLLVFCWMGQGSFRIVAGAALCLAATLTTVALNKAYVMKRIIGFFNPELDAEGAGWHILQFRHTMARGGISGAGSDFCYWARAYLPLPHSDSAFAAMVEATGFIGGLLVIAALICFAWTSYRMAMNATDSSRSIFVFCAASMLLAQAAIHVAVNVGMIPITGLTFPFFSYGGSSLLASMAIAALTFSAAGKRC